jgi:hypothetical protein
MHTTTNPVDTSTTTRTVRRLLATAALSTLLLGATGLAAAPVSAGQVGFGGPDDFVNPTCPPAPTHETQPEPDPDPEPEPEVVVLAAAAGLPEGVDPQLPPPPDHGPFGGPDSFKDPSHERCPDREPGPDPDPRPERNPDVVVARPNFTG